SATDLGGTRWSMVVLPLPEDDALATSLLGHEQFHRFQGRIGLPLTSPSNDHLDEAEPRTLMRLEWRALAAAVGGPVASSCGHQRNALPKVHSGSPSIPTRSFRWAPTGTCIPEAHSPVNGAAWK